MKLQKHSFQQLKNQVFFSMVTDNLKYLTDTKDYHTIQIEEHLLKEEKYELIRATSLFFRCKMPHNEVSPECRHFYQNSFPRTEWNKPENTFA